MGASLIYGLVMENNDGKPTDQDAPGGTPTYSFRRPTRRRVLLDTIGFWCYVWLGTAAAGGMLACVLDYLDGYGSLGLVGFAMGFALAGGIAFPVIGTVAVLTWALCLWRFRLLVAGLSGGLAGPAPVAWIYFVGGSSPREILLGAIVTGFPGMLGGGIGGWLYFRTRASQTVLINADLKPWQFTLSDLLARMTVLAMLIAAWTWAVKSALLVQ